MSGGASVGERVNVEITNGVADVRLVRADKMNALDPAMFAALVETGQRLKADAAVRAVVLSGEGRAFCAGLDMGSFAAMAQASAEGGGRMSDLTRRDEGIANHAQLAVWVWREIPVPVIAAVHGVAFGGGFQLALGADMRFVTPDARLAILEIKWGLIPDMAGTQLMWRLVREDIVRELTYTGRIFTGEEAGRIGFATRVCADPKAEALAMAREIAGKNPHAVRAAKRLLNAAATADPGAALLDETREQIALIGSRNQLEAVRANLEQRPPTFEDVTG